MQAAQDRQKSYADRKRKPIEYEVGDRVMFKGVSQSWECSKTVEKDCLSAGTSRREFTLDDNAHKFVEEPVEIMEWEIKQRRLKAKPVTICCLSSLELLKGLSSPGN
ncbi:hypothetical protein Tco_0355752 [Tanacetum coccineum]